MQVNDHQQGNIRTRYLNIQNIQQAFSEPINIKTMAIPCCKWANLLAAPLSKKNRERKPSTAKMLEVYTTAGSGKYGKYHRNRVQRQIRCR